MSMDSPDPTTRDDEAAEIFARLKENPYAADESGPGITAMIGAALGVTAVVVLCVAVLAGICFIAAGCARALGLHGLPAVLASAAFGAMGAAIIAGPFGGGDR